MDDPELKWLRHNQAALDARLARVEDSMVFRTLRAIGTFYQTTFRGDAKSSAREYRAWKARHMGTCLFPDPSWGYQPLISISISISGDGDLGSLRKQTYKNWTLDGSAGEYHAELGAGVILAPDTLARAVAALQGDKPAKVYFDHEILAATGEAQRPVFKPDWSPVLAETCDYTGPFLLTSREPGEGIVHVPRICYGAQTAPILRRPSIQGSARPLVSILICTRNAKLIARCLATLRANTAYPAYEVIVVHHTGSADDAIIESSVRDGGAKRVAYSEPFNFSSMNNGGAREAKGELLLFLNDDVEPLNAGWLGRMVAWLERPEIGVVGAKLLFPNGAIQHAGIATWVMDGAGHPGRNMTSSEYWPWLNCTREVTAVTGACLLVRKRDFDTSGGFDPQFPVNFNDVDLCLRLRDRGLSVIVDTGTVLQHDESRTRTRGVHFEERRRFFLRWAHRVEKVDPFYSPSLAQSNENLSLRD